MKRGTHTRTGERGGLKGTRELRQMDLQDGEEKGQMDRRDRRDLQPGLAECICEHTCRTCAGPLSTSTWF